jgi:hypothetical protein
MMGSSVWVGKSVGSAGGSVSSGGVVGESAAGVELASGAGATVDVGFEEQAPKKNTNRTNGMKRRFIFSPGGKQIPGSPEFAGLYMGKKGILNEVWIRGRGFEVSNVFIVPMLIIILYNTRCCSPEQKSQSGAIE